MCLFSNSKPQIRHFEIIWSSFVISRVRKSRPEGEHGWSEIRKQVTIKSRTEIFLTSKYQKGHCVFDLPLIFEKLNYAALELRVPRCTLTLNYPSVLFTPPLPHGIQQTDSSTETFITTLFLNPKLEAI